MWPHLPTYTVHARGGCRRRPRLGCSPRADHRLVLWRLLAPPRVRSGGISPAWRHSHRSGRLRHPVQALVRVWEYRPKHGRRTERESGLHVRQQVVCARGGSVAVGWQLRVALHSCSRRAGHASQSCGRWICVRVRRDQWLVRVWLPWWRSIVSGRHVPQWWDSFVRTKHCGRPLCVQTFADRSSFRALGGTALWPP